MGQCNQIQQRTLIWSLKLSQAKSVKTLEASNLTCQIRMWLELILSVPGLLRKNSMSPCKLCSLTCANRSNCPTSKASMTYLLLLYGLQCTDNSIQLMLSDKSRRDNLLSKQTRSKAFLEASNRGRLRKSVLWRQIITLQAVLICSQAASMIACLCHCPRSQVSLSTLKNHTWWQRSSWGPFKLICSLMTSFKHCRHACNFSSYCSHITPQRSFAILSRTASFPRCIASHGLSLTLHQG